MKVFKKLQQARVALLDANLKKSGKNKVVYDSTEEPGS